MVRSLRCPGICFSRVTPWQQKCCCLARKAGDGLQPKGDCPWKVWLPSPKRLRSSELLGRSAFQHNPAESSASQEPAFPFRISSGSFLIEHLSPISLFFPKVSLQRLSSSCIQSPGSATSNPCSTFAAFGSGSWSE